MLNPFRLLKRVVRVYRDPWLSRPFNIHRGNPAVKAIALTFDGDCGGQSIIDPTAAENILDVLHKNQIKCTFFLTGRFMRDYPELTQAIVEAGHEVGNHTFTHPHLYSIDALSFESELRKTEEEFKRTTGRQLAPYWRAPYGEYDRLAWKIAVRCGYTHIFWTHGKSIEENFDSNDWVDDPQSSRYFSSKQILEHISSSKKKNGAIALFHLGSRKQDPAYTIFPDLIANLNSMQYRIVRISELPATPETGIYHYFAKALLRLKL